MPTWELKCPHCGGPNAVAADRSCLACRFCGAGLWVRLPSDHTTLVAPARLKKQEAVFAWDRHLKESDQPLSRSPRDTRLLFLPFWRISAIVAIRESAESIVEQEEDQWGTFDSEGYVPAPKRDTSRDTTDVLLGHWSIKPWETTTPAFAGGLACLDSLGMRAETAPLTGWDRVVLSDESVCCRPVLEAAEALRRLEPAIASVLGMGKRVIEEQRIIAPRLTLIYWPVWQMAERRSEDPSAAEVDAVSGRIISTLTGPLPEIDAAGDSPGHAPVLVPHRCLTCGADLPVDDRYVVFVCGNCRELTAHSENGSRLIVGADYTIPESRGDQQWYPFWSFNQGRTLVPAFGIRNHRHRLRLGVIMSGAVREVTRPDEPPRHLAGVAVGPEVAAGLARIILERGQVVPETTTPDTEPRLIYAPMKTVGRELVDPVTGLCIAGNVISAF